MGAAGWLLAFYLGAAHTQRAALTFSPASPAAPLTLRAVDFRGESFTPPLYYGCRVTYFPNRSWFGIEGEVTHLKVYANLPPDALVQRFSMSHGLNLLLVNVAARKIVGRSGRLTVLTRAGAGPTVPHVESTIAGTSHEGYELGSIALHAGAGMEVALRPHMSLLAEYKVTRTRERVRVARGEARGLFVSHHVSFGFAWRTR